MDLKKVYQEFKKGYTTEPQKKDDRVLIIDGLNTFIRVFSAVPSLNDDGQHVGGVVGFLKSIGSNIRQFQATRCIVVFDGIGGSTRRRKIYSDYKKGKKRDRFNRFEEFDGLVDEEQSMKLQFQRLTEYFDYLPITVLSIDNIEADDTIAYIAVEYYKNVDNKITIVSTDRDYYQLLSNKISVYSPIKKKIYTPDLYEKEFGFVHDNALLYRSFDGDISDNIPGVKGVGIKTLIKAIPEFVSQKIEPDTLFDICQKKIDEGSSAKLYKLIVEGRSEMERNLKLMDLRLMNFSGQFMIDIVNILNQPIEKLNVIEFKKLFLQDKLYENIKDVDTWLRDTFIRLNKFSG